jgi:hypothetical protein
VVVCEKVMGGIRERFSGAKDWSKRKLYPEFPGRQRKG